MCTLTTDEIKAMSNTDLASFIKEHRAVFSAHLSDEVAQDPYLQERAVENTRSRINDFIRVEAAKGRCDPVRFTEFQVQDRTVMSGETYVIPPAVMQEIQRRLLLSEPVLLEGGVI